MSRAVIHIAGDTVDGKLLCARCGSPIMPTTSGPDNYYPPGGFAAGERLLIEPDKAGWARLDLTEVQTILGPEPVECEAR
jgi:hypothetical protein